MGQFFISKIRLFSTTLDQLLQNLANSGRNRKQYISIAIDAALSVVSLWLAYSLRQGVLFTGFSDTVALFILLPCIAVGLSAAFGIYRWVVRTSNSRLTKQVVKAGISTSLSLLVLMYLFPSGPEIRSLFIIYFVIYVGSMLAIRWIWRELLADPAATNGMPTAIYGAGRHGRELAALLHGGSERKPVFFFDDDDSLVGSTISGLPVYKGDPQEIQLRLQNEEIACLIVADPKLSASQYSELLSLLRKTETTIQTVPTLSEIIAGISNAGQTRNISITDLLGRREIAPNTALLGQTVTGKVILITGGGGSIGSEICKQAMLLNPSKIIVLEQSEENLYSITEEIEQLIFKKNMAGADCHFVPVLGSVTSETTIARILKAHKVQTIYHAAAYKHVPIIENNVTTGYRTNVLGTKNVLDRAIEANVETFVLVSTDKAVRPTSVMGATKRLAELILQAKAAHQSNTVVCIVRFGNVLGSSGSVIPKFKTQISEGGPITLTHRDITRYFMSIPEASQLVLQASSLARGGEVFVLDMGEAVKIVDLAKSMIYLSGRSVKDEQYPGGDIEIIETGLRPGEKLYEELFISDSVASTQVEKIMVAHEHTIPWKELDPHIKQLNVYLEKNDGESLTSLLFDIISSGIDKEDDRNLKQPENVIELPVPSLVS